MLWIKQEDRHEIWAEDIYFLTFPALHIISILWFSNQSIHSRFENRKNVHKVKIRVYTQLHKYLRSIDYYIYIETPNNKIKKICQCARTFYSIYFSCQYEPGFSFYVSYMFDWFYGYGMGFSYFLWKEHHIFYKF